MTAAAHSRASATAWSRWSAAGVARVRKSAAALKGRATNLRSAVLQTGALAAGTASAWTINTTCGLAALCVALFVLEALTDQPAGDR